jgi:histidinol dehydrogenase
MLTLYTVPQARKTILRRADTFLDEAETLTAAQREASERLYGAALTPEQAVRHILRDVRHRGDAALHDWTARLDGVTVPALRVPDSSLREAMERLDPDLLAALRLSADRIHRFHALQPLPDWTTTTLGGILGQRTTPLDSVGVYVPGGTAPLPSSLLMSAIPARVAGVGRIVAITPPDRHGGVPDIILAAAAIAGVEALYLVGGAQAVAALAFGTETIPRVDKIVGPGNRYVTLAKQQVYGIVGIDGLYGPTETVVVADDSADPVWVAADMLAQAEHDPLSAAILFTPSADLAAAVQAEVARQLPERHRAAIIRQALAGQSGIVLTADLDEACALASAFAAEHTCIATAHPQDAIAKIPHAGGLFVGERSFEVLGDYIAGPSHVMPTGGTARFASPLSVADFVKISSIVQLDARTSAELSPVAARIALAEGLDGHAAAALLRCEA